MIKHFLSFEKQISDLEGKIEELRHLSSGGDINIAEEIGKLQGAVDKELKSTYSNLSPWQKVQVSRHPERPHFQDIVKFLFDDYIPLSGDRNFSDDNALTGGTAFFRKKSVIIIGIDKGKNTTDRISKNFGMARPEGYRKAIRLMELANKFSLPVLMFVDTAGAYPGKGAEERGQAQAIASCIQKSLEIKVPTISIITGEGGSGGAVALAVANNTLMLEHAIYSVISPEGCSSILWRSSEHANIAAESLKLTAQDMFRFGIIDEIIAEPVGGAHRDAKIAINEIGNVIEKRLEALLLLSKDELSKSKEEKYLKIS
ncbi:MAG: acetyl-CoA carboxylase carboxyltransferase subunit alpha [Alphaproteobacteria bacterium]|jgi:acetyl-CoA carboxylase carboxyl transferase subunit alpha|nr:acetyl-CoA carboxylase carboxyltransferase subunit alpha [Alphaproteobacteria bacterium]MBL6851649.1 acetyl-CoA carboxylase carboxyltransferase subunit alpha [Alphaproteobacteria bacterium]